MRALILVALVGCTSGNGNGNNGNRPVDSGRTDVDTEVPDVEVTLAAECLPTLNPLRMACEAVVSDSRALAFRFGSDAEDRIIELPANTVHAFVLSGMTADTAFTWTAEAGGASAVGDFRTGIPNGVPDIVVTGEATFDFVLFAHKETLHIANTQGELVWYKPLPDEGDGPQGGRMTGTSWLGDGIAFSISSTLYEIGLDGEFRFESRRGVGHDLPLHHDVFVRDGLRYSVNAQMYTFDGHDFVIDGFYVFDDDGLYKEWSLGDHLDSDPVWTNNHLGFWSDEWPGAEDFAHANSVSAAEDGTILFSTRYLDRVYGIAGVDSPNFGDVLWTLDGQGGGDFVIGGSPDGLDNFDGQHHAELHGDTLTLFDNRTGNNARTMSMQLDHVAGTATVDEVHSLNQSCNIQGANYILGNGNVLATCGSDRDIYEFVGGVDEAAIWSLSLEANDQPSPRGIPIEVRPVGW